MQDIIIRNATVSDARWIASIQVHSWKTTYTGIISEKYLDTLDINQGEDKWSERIKNWSTINIAESWELVWFIDYWKSREKTEYDWEIYALYILQEFQGKWIGRKLFLSAIDALIKKGYKSIYLWVLAENPARWFYEKMGGIIIDKKGIEIDGNILKEIAYGWKDILSLSKS